MATSYLPSIMGAFLIIAGVLQVFIQMRISREIEKQMIYRAKQDFQSAHVGPDGFKVQSAYPGMTMVCFGALLLVAAQFFGR